MATATATATPDVVSAAVTPSSESSSSTRTSRSGRVLKSKKLDDPGSETLKVEEETPAKKKDDQKLYVQLKATKEVVEVDVKEDLSERCVQLAALEKPLPNCSCFQV